MKKTIIPFLCLAAPLVIVGCNEHSSSGSYDAPTFEGSVGTSTDVDIDTSPMASIVKRTMTGTRDSDHWFTHKYKVDGETYAVKIWSELLGDSVNVETDTVLEGEHDFIVKGDSFMSVNAVDYWKDFDGDDPSDIDPEVKEYTVNAYYEAHSQDLVDGEEDEFTAEIINESVGLVTWQASPELGSVGKVDEIILRLKGCDDGVVVNEVKVLHDDFDGDDSVPSSGYRYLHSATKISQSNPDWSELTGLNCKLEIEYTVTIDDGEGEFTRNGTAEISGDFNPRVWKNITFNYTTDGDTGEGTVDIDHDVDKDWDEADDDNIDLTPNDVALPDGGVIEGAALKHARELGYSTDELIELATLDIVAQDSTAQANIRLSQVAVRDGNPVNEVIMTIRGEQITKRYESYLLPVKDVWYYGDADYYNEVDFSLDRGLVAIGVRTMHNAHEYLIDSSDDSPAIDWVWDRNKLTGSCTDEEPALALAVQENDGVDAVVPSFFHNEARVYCIDKRLSAYGFEFEYGTDPELMDSMIRDVVDPDTYYTEFVGTISSNGETLNSKTARPVYGLPVALERSFESEQSTLRGSNELDGISLSDPIFKIAELSGSGLN
ncbi:hypothetical protein [Vibrio astriarenae]|uniref:hypothetical protein n=1 Tax=Vibrio astriarenae TaxID=1481923 RepID=UPI0037359284